MSLNIKQNLIFSQKMKEFLNEKKYLGEDDQDLTEQEIYDILFEDIIKPSVLLFIKSDGEHKYHSFVFKEGDIVLEISYNQEEITYRINFIPKLELNYSLN